MYCNACDVDRRLLTLGTLASNLAIAGALCESYQRGSDSEHYANRNPWFPGHALAPEPTP